MKYDRTKENMAACEVRQSVRNHEIRFGDRVDSSLKREHINIVGIAVHYPISCIRCAWCDGERRQGDLFLGVE